ncbi:hypothetical protein [uncultured Draconibacterium sp.]|uniref:hypothetical protein n=1 Tax=uncultured Draconibacterium sp. TaxID=1573823 RepID=UPI0025EC1D10|nr:hypothetical protein [uncultured Draconibacterium sp.]
MTFSERSIKYADLLVPIKKCPLGEAVPDCPFVEYWQIKDETKQMNLIEELPEEKLDALREFHRKCLAIKIKQAQKETAEQYKKQKI